MSEDVLKTANLPATSLPQIESPFAAGSSRWSSTRPKKPECCRISSPISQLQQRKTAKFEQSLSESGWRNRHFRYQGSHLPRILRAVGHAIRGVRRCYGLTLLETTEWLKVR